MRNRRQSSERGFALLFVFVMAAVIAISLYMELPRAAFEAQRQREQMLIDRGEQYIRGIQLYVAKNKRYPANMDDLEKTGTIHYIRHRYKDPMTGDDQWRLIHTDGMRLTDSLIQKDNPLAKKETFQNTFISEGPAIGSTGTGSGTGAVNMALRRRPSEQHPEVPGMGTPLEGQPGAPPPPLPTDPNATHQEGAPKIDPATGLPVQTQNQPGQPGTQNPGTQPGAVPPGTQQPGTTPAGMQPGMQPIGAQPGMQGGMQPGQQQPSTGGQPGAFGQNTNAGANPATDMIRNMLTRPNAQMNPTAGGGMAAGLGPGIAGVASKLEADSIKLYNERQKYNEWEFVYDMSKDKSRGTGNANMPGQNQQQQQQKSNNSPFSSGFGNNNGGSGSGGGFGNNNNSGSGGFGGNGSFGGTTNTTPTPKP